MKQEKAEGTTKQEKPDHAILIIRNSSGFQQHTTIFKKHFLKISTTSCLLKTIMHKPMM